MREVLIEIIGVLGYASGLLVWPVCLMAWRRKRRRTTALCWMFIAEIICQLVLIGFFVFSHGMLEHQYYWLMLMIMVNLGFTPLALAAALYDYGRDSRIHAD